jgi:hypothetical protein
MTEILPYHSVAELRQMSLSEVQALWELVPTDRQRAYKSAYDREIRSAGALGSDGLELQVAQELLKRYEASALIPLGMRWARTPSRVQEAARQNLPLETAEVASPSPSQLNPQVLLGLGVFILLIVGWLLFQTGNRSTATLTATPSLTPTPLVSPTPTPLALEAQDEVIQGGDAGREVAYPINLQVVLPNDTAPRVWVVQRRRVQASEWNFDPNPDTASFINGMSVRPVIGIPWSEENAQFFASIQSGTRFMLTMNTGALLRYEFLEVREVRRSDTTIFRQVSPGLVVVLMGETDVEGLPTARRTLILATYPPEQELSREGLTLAQPIVTTGERLPTPTALPTGYDGVAVQLIEVSYLEGQLTTRLRIYNGRAETLRFTPNDLWLALGYAPDPPGPRVPAENLIPFDLLPEQAIDLTLTWQWRGEPFASLGVGQWRFAFSLEE